MADRTVARSRSGRAPASAKKATPAKKAVPAIKTLGELPSTVQRYLPPTGRMLYYAGLGALAALDVLSWPVAAAIGGGVWVASRGRSGTG
jgi:hypothetical protein